MPSAYHLPRYGQAHTGAGATQQGDSSSGLPPPAAMPGQLAGQSFQSTALTPFSSNSSASALRVRYLEQVPGPLHALSPPSPEGPSFAARCPSDQLRDSCPAGTAAQRDAEAPVRQVVGSAEWPLSHSGRPRPLLQIPCGFGGSCGGRYGDADMQVRSICDSKPAERDQRHPKVPFLRFSCPVNMLFCRRPVPFSAQPDRPSSHIAGSDADVRMHAQLATPPAFDFLYCTHNHMPACLLPLCRPALEGCQHAPQAGQPSLGTRMTYSWCGFDRVPTEFV